MEKDENQNLIDFSPVMNISYEKINYLVDQTKDNGNRLFSFGKSKSKKQILFDLSGVFTTGMNAILGPTGCGKSTFLDILADRKDTHGLTGNILVNGQTRPKNYKYCIGYVLQEDVISGTLTVRENLMFSANLRLQKSLSFDQRIERVNEIIDQLDLEMCAETLIGTDFVRGISGGEKKRTSIGMELILSPKILFLDEPTTGNVKRSLMCPQLCGVLGLDASTAQNVINCLHKLSRQGRTIVFSIHQPRYSIFKLFDRILLLSNGHTVYFDSPKNVLSYFTANGFSCEEDTNPADFILDILIDSKNASSQLLSNAYLQSPMHSNNLSLIQSINAQTTDRPLLFEQYLSRSAFLEFYYLSQRTFRNAIRNPLLNITQILIALILGLLTGLLFYNMKTTIEPGISNRIGAIFFLATHQILCTASALEPLIKERILFSHEITSGYYRVVTYFLAKLVCDLIPMRVIPTCVFAMIAYPLMGFQRSFNRFFTFFITIFLSSVFGSALCFLIAACIPVFAVALIVSILAFSIMMVVSGFLVDLESIFSALRWIKWISAIRYSSNLLTINEFGNLTFCLSDDSQVCPIKGEEVLSKRKIPHQNDWDLWKNLVFIGIMALICFILAYVRLLRIKKFK
ncbi:unnamed protein product [Adineta ricciae]|nr:unnamed protein product [Adineta ricciae]